MTILYIGLGLAMISGISAMMQIGNNVNNLMLLSTFKKNIYYETELPSYDRQILNILNNYSGPASEVCSTVKQANISDALCIEYYLPENKLLSRGLEQFTSDNVPQFLSYRKNGYFYWFNEYEQCRLELVFVNELCKCVRRYYHKIHHLEA